MTFAWLKNFYGKSGRQYRLIVALWVSGAPGTPLFTSALLIAPDGEAGSWHN